MTDNSNHHQPQSKFAYVTLVMQDESYAIGALVLAYSLKHVAKTSHDLVVMVTQDISQRIRDALSTLFDHVIQVPVIETKTRQKLGQKFQHYYNTWIDKCFTKCNALNLTQYEKVVFLDADMVAWKCPDDLFELRAPAGVCSAVEDQEACHGKPIPEQVVRDSLNQYGIRGFLYLLRPNESDYEEMKRIVTSSEFFGDNEHYIGPDEKLFTEFYLSNWTHVHNKYGYIAWKAMDDNIDPVITHFITEKPWAPSKEWKEQESWDNVAISMLKQYPKLSFLFANNDAVIQRFSKWGYELTTDEMVHDDKYQTVKQLLIPYITTDETRQINLPYTDFEKLSEEYGHQYVVRVLSEFISNGLIGFPFKKYTFTEEQVSLMFKRLVDHKPIVENAPFRIPSLKSISKEFLFPVSFREPNQYCIHVSPDSDYNSMDILSDYFQEECRLNAKRIDTNINSIQFWNSRAGNGQVLNHLLERKSDINSHELRESLYFVHKECTQFKPSLAKFVYETLGGTRILDFSAGWGDRLLAALATNVDLYYATDPNIALKQGHSAMINRFAAKDAKSKFHIQYEPFQTADIPANLKFNLVFTSPPFFDLERYTVEHEGQSIDDFPELNDWLVKFLFTSLEKSWSYLEDKGHLAIHITDTYHTKICEIMNIFMQTQLSDSHYVGVIASRGMADKARPIWVWQKRSDLAQSQEIKGKITHAKQLLSKYYGSIADIIQQSKPLYIPILPEDQVKRSSVVYDNIIHSYVSLYKNTAATSYYQVESTRAIKSFESVVTETNNAFKNLVLGVKLSDFDQASSNAILYQQDLEFCVRQLMMPQFINRELSDLKQFSIVVPNYSTTSTRSGIMLHSILETIGFKKSGNMGMYLNLDDYKSSDDAGDPSISIKLVTSKTALLDFCEVNKKAYNGVLSKEEEELFMNLKESDIVRRWVAYKRDDGQDIAIGCASVCYNLANNSCHVMDISVLPNHRGHGLGSRLTRTTISDAIERGTQFCTLGSTWKAQNMYARLGFEEVEEMRYYRYLGARPQQQQQQYPRRDYRDHNREQNRDQQRDHQRDHRDQSHHSRGPSRSSYQPPSYHKRENYQDRDTRGSQDDHQHEKRRRYH